VVASAAAPRLWGSAALGLWGSGALRRRVVASGCLWRPRLDRVVAIGRGAGGSGGQLWPLGVGPTASC